MWMLTDLRNLVSSGEWERWKLNKFRSFQLTFNVFNTDPHAVRRASCNRQPSAGDLARNEFPGLVHRGPRPDVTDILRTSLIVSYAEALLDYGSGASLV